MKKYLLLLVCILNFVLAPAVLAAQSKTPSPKPKPAQPTEALTLIYKEFDKPASDVNLWVFFYDEAKKNWVNHQVKTDKHGVIDFKIPLRSDRHSYLFWFASSKGEMLTKMKALKKGTEDGLRLLKTGAQTVLEISTEKGKFSYQVKSGKCVEGTL